MQTARIKSPYISATDGCYKFLKCCSIGYNEKNLLVTLETELNIFLPSNYWFIFLDARTTFYPGY